jgi:nitrite reductase/ring-hydroxylating ferredoxin subunit
MLMDVPIREFVLAGSLEELKAKGRLVLHGGHRPILVIYDRGRVFALDNRCPHMGFPLERGSVEDGILTCHWHHARFDLDTGHSLDFINKAFECLDLIGWEHAAAVLPTVVGQMVAARGAEESTAWASAH